MIRKSEAAQLAIFGAPPLFDQLLHVGRPNLPEKRRVLSLISEALDRRWLSNNGPLVQQFENMIRTAVGAKHCIAVVNGTVALEIAARAMGLSGQVIVPSFTFVASAHALQWQEISPVFCDIEQRSHLLDPEVLEQHVTPRTTGVLGVHLWGNSCNIEAIERICDRRGLQLLLDGSHAFGSTYRGKPIGGSGHTTVFSFHATKFVNSFEGGAIVTGNDVLAARIRLMVNFGFAGYDNVVHVGTNGKMHEASAAMGIASLEMMPSIVARNRSNKELYRSLLRGIPGVTIVPNATGEENNDQYVVLLVDEDDAGLSRDSLLKVLHSENVLARRYFWPGCHRMEPYRSLFPYASHLLPVTELVASQVLVLPTGTAVTDDEIGGVTSVIRTTLENSPSVVERLALLP